MPAPAALLVAAGITAVASNPIFIHFVYDPLIAPTLERLAENYIKQRRARSKRPAASVDGLPRPGADDNNGIPLNRMRRRSFTYSTSTSYASGDGDEELGLLMVQKPDQNVSANTTLHRRPVVAYPVVDNTVLGESSLQSSTTAREPNMIENINSTAALSKRPVSVDNNNNCSFGSKRRTTLVSVQDKELHLEPAVAVSGLSLAVVPEWKTTVSQDPLRPHETRRSKDQIQWMSSVVDRRPPSASSTIPNTISVVPTAPFPPVPSSSILFRVSDEESQPNPDTLPQTLIYPTHLITNSSVPSTSSSTPSGARNVVFTPPSHQSALFSGTISTNAGINGNNLSKTCVSDPWHGMSGSPLATQDGGLDSPVSTLATHSTPSLKTDGSSDSSSTFQFSVPHNTPRAPPQLPPLPIFSPLCVSSMSLSTHSNQSTSPTSHQPFMLQLPPQLPNTPPAQHLHCVHYSAPPNATVPSSEIYQQHRFVSPGVMSSQLSELDFI